MNDKTLVFEVNTKDDARILCEHFAMNGYMTAAQINKNSVNGKWFVFVDRKGREG